MTLNDYMYRVISFNVRLADFLTRWYALKLCYWAQIVILDARISAFRMRLAIVGFKHTAVIPRWHQFVSWLHGIGA